MTSRERDALFTLTGGSFNPAGYREVYVDGKTYWVPTRDRAAFERKLQAAALLGGWVSLVPRIGLDRHYCDRSSVVWARIESGAARASLAAFKPEPTLILQDGETLKCTALWWLSVELNRGYLVKANERLAQELGGLMAASWPEGWVSPPGPGTRVRVTHLDVEALYHPDQVVGTSRPDGRRLADRRQRHWPRRVPHTAREAIAA